MRRRGILGHGGKLRVEWKKGLLRKVGGCCSGPVLRPGSNHIQIPSTLLEFTCHGRLMNIPRLYILYLNYMNRSKFFKLTMPTMHSKNRLCTMN